MRRLVLPLLLASLTFTARADIRTLDVGRNPESVTRGFGGDYFVTIMGERGSHPDAATDGEIRRVSPSGRVRVFSRGGLAEPKGIVFTGEALVTADGKNVWKIAADGSKTLLAGLDQFPEPPVYLNDVANDPRGEGVYVTDMNNSGELFATGSFAPLDDAGILARKPHGRVYHIAWNGTVTLALGDSPLMRYPNGVFVEPDGRILATSFWLGHVVAGYPGEAPQVIATGYRSGDGVEIDDHGNLYVLEVLSGKIWQLPPHGRAPRLLHTAQSAADHYLDRDSNTLVVPDSKAGQLVFIDL
ncbi:SMP-30/gluconolactonase/LRE family protein [Synoicihabitans lomoniglobus]|uniref:SMP-30/gluconolactonase/LRE family protein n=2 Tax=Synoicihabitans lomoniglobus TaxID=2909285 RepID=A0AAE9ZU45_9BACT|nr:SMP-30/gluconolactonase/LRE family protein [Opitutaceae bacterium LMO-M01]